MGFNSVFKGLSRGATHSTTLPVEMMTGGGRGGEY